MDTKGKESTRKAEQIYEYLNVDEINYLEYFFNKFKKNKNENVSIQNIRKFLLESHNKDICDELLDVFYNLGNSITCEQFLTALNCDMSTYKTNEQVKTLFGILDQNNNGFITYKNFVYLAKEFENEFDESTLKQIFNIIDLHNDDKIVYDDFKNAISNI